MITRRNLFLGSAAIILTPGLLMPVRKPLTATRVGFDFSNGRDMTAIVESTIERGVLTIDRFRIIETEFGVGYLDQQQARCNAWRELYRRIGRKI
jgi:hypothetical protein